MATLTVDSPYGTHISNAAAKAVTSEVEFPDGSLTSTSGSFFIIGVSIDVDANKIVVKYTQNALASVSSFNGYVIKFPDAAPAIARVELDPSSSFTLSQVGISIKDREVAINVSGLSVRRGDSIVFNLALAQ